MPGYTIHSLLDPSSMCSDPKNFVDDVPPRYGQRIRTVCKVCGDFVGYRPMVVDTKKKAKKCR